MKFDDHRHSLWLRSKALRSVDHCGSCYYMQSGSCYYMQSVCSSGLFPHANDTGKPERV